MKTTELKKYDDRGQFIEVVNHHTEETRIFDNLKRISMIDRELSRLSDKRRENPFLIVSSLGISMHTELLELRKARLIEQNRELDRVLAKKPSPQRQMIYLGEERPPWRVSGTRMARFASLLSRQHQFDMMERQLDEVWERKANLLAEISKSATGIADARQREELDEIDNRESSLMTKAEGLRMEIIPEEKEPREEVWDDKDDNREQEKDEHSEVVLEDIPFDEADLSLCDELKDLREDQEVNSWDKDIPEPEL